MKLAFVTPWYGPDIPGGAEALARRTAVHLQRAGHDVEVLTTCIRDFHADWATNHHRPGLSADEGVRVRRFRVQKRDKLAFDQVNGQLMQGRAISAAAEATFNQEMIRCPDLLAFIDQHQHDYLFFFIPYMFATSYQGAQICPARSAMIPCLHDEAYARLQVHQQVLPQMRALIFNAAAEQTLADRLFPGTDGQIRAVVGTGIATDWQGDGERFRQKYGLDETPIVLYVGRREPGKNTPLLLHYWQQYVHSTWRPARLVLIGSGDVHMPDSARAHIVDLGFVSREDKNDAYAAANIFCMPSVHESFSIVIMESWLAGTPVLVHGDCAVTHEHCVNANGGLYFTTYSEFAATVDYLLDQPETAAQLGAQGRRYVLANFQWEQIIAQFNEIIERMATV